MREIVKYDNKLNNFNYGRFSAVEADIFFSLVARIRNSDGLLIMSFDELKKLSNYYSRDEKRFVHDLEGTFTKYLNLKYRDDDGETIKITNVFQQLLISREKKLVTVQVTPGMEDAILSISENFTRFELQEFTNLKSSYSKTLYRLLKQWRTVGKLYISIDEFRFKLDIPKSYRMTHIDERVISPAINELSVCFQDLKCRKEYKKSSSGRGRPMVKGFTFTFAPEEIPIEQEQKTKVPYPCPRCGGQLIERMMNGKIALCHADGHLSGAPCKAIFNGYDEVKFNNPYLNPPEASAEASEPITETEKENARTIKGLLKNIFG